MQLARGARATFATAVALTAVLSAAACSSSTATSPAVTPRVTLPATPPTSPTVPTPTPPTTVPTPTARAGTSATTTATPGPVGRPSASTSRVRETRPVRRHPVAALPQGGHRILGHYRVVAYYGGPDGPALGVLGSADPDTVAQLITHRAQQWRGYGLKVQPAMELIASVAQAGPGPSGLYSAPIPDAAVERYLAVAHRYKMLLVLDIQPGRGEFLPQVEHFARFLADPSVSVALDPEWKMSPGQVPGTVIGSSSAASVVAVRDYLADLVATKHLPDKLLIVHQFTPPMLPDRSLITPRHGIEVVFHADGFGTQSEKIATWRTLQFPGRPFGSGFKLFLRDDTDLMSAPQVMALRPRPDVITYQ